MISFLVNENSHTTAEKLPGRLMDKIVFDIFFTRKKKQKMTGATEIDILEIEIQEKFLAR